MGALPFTLKAYLEANLEEFMETQIFHHAKILIFLKILLKETKILQDIITLL